MDATSELTRFWIGGSLSVSPEEQQAFWLKLYRNQIPVSTRAVEQVKAMLIQPTGVIVNAAGEQPFAAGGRTRRPSARRPGARPTGRARVRWLAGHVKKGSRTFVFVSCVIGAGDVAANAAIDLAARSLREAGVL